jgi:hypothetical protein
MILYKATLFKKNNNLPLLCLKGGDNYTGKRNYLKEEVVKNR